jgi:hypothetical protein
MGTDMPHQLMIFLGIGKSNPGFVDQGTIKQDLSGISYIYMLSYTSKIVLLGYYEV